MHIVEHLPLGLNRRDCIAVLSSIFTTKAWYLTIVHCRGDGLLCYKHEAFPSFTPETNRFNPSGQLFRWRHGICSTW
jgi:hypothetical protein